MAGNQRHTSPTRRAPSRQRRAPTDRRGQLARRVHAPDVADRVFRERHPRALLGPRDDRRRCGRGARVLVRFTLASKSSTRFSNAPDQSTRPSGRWARALRPLALMPRPMPRESASGCSSSSSPTTWRTASSGVQRAVDARRHHGPNRAPRPPRVLRMSARTSGGQSCPRLSAILRVFPRGCTRGARWTSMTGSCSSIWRASAWSSACRSRFVPLTGARSTDTWVSRNLPNHRQAIRSFCRSSTPPSTSRASRARWRLAPACAGRGDPRTHNRAETAFRDAAAVSAGRVRAHDTARRHEPWSALRDHDSPAGGHRAALPARPRHAASRGGGQHDFTYRPATAVVLTGDPTPHTSSSPPLRRVWPPMLPGTTVSLGVGANLHGLKLVIAPSDGDNFLRNLVGNAPMAIDVPLGIEWRASGCAGSRAARPSR